MAEEIDVVEILERIAEHGTAPKDGCSLFGFGYEEAFDRLSSALDHGFENRNDLIGHDTDLDALRGDPRFKAIVSRATAAGSDPRPPHR